MLIYKFNSFDAYENLALEEAILKNFKTTQDIFLIYQNKNAIIVGRNQNTFAEINQEFVEKNNVQVVRRISGGGSVYHDLGNVNFSIITSNIDSNFQEILLPIIDFLKTLGIKAEFIGKNDIQIENKKISGNAQFLYKNRLLHHGTLLFNVDFSKLVASLKTDTKKMISKGIESVRQRVVNISDFLSKSMSVDDFIAQLFFYFTKKTSAKNLVITNEIKKAQEEIIILRKDWNWIYGNSPKFSINHKARFAGGSLDINMEVDNGIIENIKFFGDFLSRKELFEIEGKLLKVKFIKQVIYDVLNKFEIDDYFGSITSNEIVQLMFGELE